MFELMWKVLTKVDAARLPLTRLSVHAINFHMLCFDRDVWRAGKDSVASSIAVSLQIAGGYTKENFNTIGNDLDKLRFNLPEKLSVRTKYYGFIVKSKEELIKTPIFNFHYGRFD